jgi:hypothetical protein
VPRLNLNQKFDACPLLDCFKKTKITKTKMEFIVLIEKNYTENEIFIHYCQLTGNEEEMGKFLKYVNKADYKDLYFGDYSDVVDGVNARILVAEAQLLPESDVDACIGLRDPNGYLRMFQKHVGKFTCPDHLDSVANEYDIANEMDDIFYGSNACFSNLFSSDS